MKLPAPVHSCTILQRPHDCILNPAATVQSARNYHAMLAARALGRLSGQLQGASATPRCQAAAAALSALLTPALAAKLASPDPKPLLMHLNSFLLNPQVRELPGLLLEGMILNILEKFGWRAVSRNLCRSPLTSTSGFQSCGVACRNLCSASAIFWSHHDAQMCRWYGIARCERRCWS